MAMWVFDLSSLLIKEVTSSQKGIRGADISLLDGYPAVVNLEGLQVAFEPSIFNDVHATRVNIVWRPNERVEAMLTSLDEWIVSAVAANPVKYFGKAKSEDSIRESYTPILKLSDKYPAQFKAKLNLSEPCKVRVWDEDKNPRDAPESWVDCLTAPRLKLRSLWFGAAQWGAVLECTDIQVLTEESAATCPF